MPKLKFCLIYSYKLFNITIIIVGLNTLAVDLIMITCNPNKSSGNNDKWHCILRTYHITYEDHRESKERLRIQSAQLLCCSRSFVSGIQCDVEKFPHAVVAVAIALPIENPTIVRCEMLLVLCMAMRSVILQKRQPHAWNCSFARQCTSAYCPADTSIAVWEIPLGHLRASSIQSGPGTVELFFSKMKEHLAGRSFANDEDLKDAGWITRRPNGKKRAYTNWCQGTTSALMSKETMRKSSQRYVPKLVYSVSVLLLKNILVWRNVLCFMNGHRTFVIQLKLCSLSYCKLFPILLS